MKCACVFENRDEPDFSGKPPVQLECCGFHSLERMDAARYRRIREEWSNRKWRHVPIGDGQDGDDITTPDEIDAAVDALMAPIANGADK